jgi:hypothetical protein
VASAILAKSVRKTRRIIPSGETTNCPVARSATVTTPALRRVRLILLMIQVRIRW